MTGKLRQLQKSAVANCSHKLAKRSAPVRNLLYCKMKLDHAAAGMLLANTFSMNGLSRNLLVVMVGALFLVAGCVVREQATYSAPAVSVGGEVDVSGPPPAPIDETVTVSPGVGFIWIGGAWAWGPGGWHWEAGRWGRPPHAGAVWVPHHYAYRGGRHVWVRGGWR
jgi:hypothetical protein